MADQPEALRLADSLAAGFSDCGPEAAAELRRLVAVNQELLEALKRIKQTGVFVGAIAQEMMDAAIAKAEGQA
jgi:ABC-type transporter Mla subunit MlaD